MSTVRIQVRRGTAADWNSIDPKLAAGELGFETDTLKIKIGDGDTVWTLLDYISSDAPAIDELAQDAIAQALTMGSGISKTYNDLLNTITLANTGVLSFNTRTGAVTLSDTDIIDALGYTPADAADVSTLISNTPSDIADAITTAEQYTDTAISNLVDGAPDLLNTLNELAAAINDDAGFSSTIATTIGGKVAKSGDTMTGALTLSGAPTSDLHAATKKYVDDQTTTDVSEGTNLYYTDERAQDAIGSNVGNGLSYDDATGAISVNTSTIQARVSGVSDTEIGYLDGVTSAIQTQLNAKLDSADLTEAAQDAVNTALVAGTGLGKVYADNANTITLSIDNTVVTKTDSQTLTNKTIDFTNNSISGTIAEFNIALSDANFATLAGTETLTNKTLTSPKINENVALTAKASELNILDGATLSTVELNYVDGVTSSIQTQLDSKLASANLTEAAQDAVNTALVAGTGLDKTYDDANNTITIDIDSTVATKDFAAELLTNATKSNITITGDKNGLTITAENGVADSTTSDLTEGTNLYFTNERAQDAVGNILGTGLVYNDSTNAIGINPGEMTSIVVNGVSGNSYGLVGNSTYLNVVDPTGYNSEIELDVAALESKLDTDGYITTSSSSTLSNKTISGSNNTISNIANTSLTNSSITINGTSVSLGGSRTLGTDDVAEGSTNKYYTDERAQDAIGNSLGSGLSYNDSTGAISVNRTTVDTWYDAAGAAAAVTASTLGLGNVDNTSDANKPVSTATQTALDLKAPKADPTFTGTPAAPTALAVTNSTQIATTAFVHTAVDNLINGAGAAYDTLKELSDLIIADESTASALATTVGNKAPKADPTFTGTVTLPLTTSGYVTTTGSGVISSVATIPNSGLTNSGFTINGTAISLGETKTITAAAGTLTGDTLASGIHTSSLTSVGTLTNLTVTNTITGSVSGNAGTVTNGVYTTDSGTVTNTMLSGSIANNKLTNSAITINGTSVSLGGSRTLGTDDVAEGSTNKYYTDERAQDAIGNSLGSGLSYDDATGAISVNTSTIQARVSGVSDTEIGYLDGVTSAIQTQLNAKAPIASPTFTGTVSGVTKSMVDLGNVDNTSDANKPVSTATQTALDLKAPIASPTFTGTVAGITKSMVGLSNVDNTSDSNKPVSTATSTALDGKLALAGGTMTGALTLSGAPTSDLHAATKAYVDAAANGINVHEAVVAATTGNVNLTSAVDNNKTLDGVTLSTGDRILVKNQSVASANGIYIVASSGAPTRAADYNAAGEVSAGDFIFVSGGTINDNTGWIQTEIVTTVGTDSLAFTQFSGAGTYTASTGLTLTGSAFSIDTATTVDKTTAQTLTNKTFVAPVLGAATATSINGTTIPSSKTLITTADSGTVTSTMIADGTIVDADINASAAIASTKISGTAVTQADSGTVTNTMLAGSIANSKLVNAKVTVGTTDINLGSSSTTLAGLTSVTSTSFTGALTGNASTVTNGVYTTDSGTVTNTMLAGSIANNKLSNSSITINGTSVSLGGSRTLTTSDISEGTNLYYTDERAQDSIGNSLGTGLSYNDTTGAISVDTATIQARVANVSDTEIGYLDGVTSAIQTQLNAKFATADASTTNISEGTNKYFTDERAQDAVGGILGSGLTYNDSANTITVDSSVIQLRVTGVSDTEIGYLDGVTSSIQTQLGDKAALASPTFTGTPAAPTASSVTNSTQIATTAFVKTAVDNLINGAGAAYDTLKELSDLIIADESTASALATTVGNKAPKADPTFTGTVTLPLTTSGYVTTTGSGVISSVATIPNSGLTNSAITINGTSVSLGGTRTLTTSDISEGTNLYYTDERAQDSIGNNLGTGLSYNDTTGAISVNTSTIQARVANVSDTEIGYLDGVTSAIQTQIDGKSPTAGSSSITTLGTVTTGTWSATTIATTKGGTGLTGYTAGDIVYASATDTLAKLAKGTDGKLLTMVSGAPAWADAPVSLPTQTSHSGQYLTTNGSTASWATVEALPTQTSNSGKYLTTDGTSASWSTLSTPTLALEPVVISIDTAVDIDYIDLTNPTAVEYTIIAERAGNQKTLKLLVHGNNSFADSTEYGIMLFGLMPITIQAEFTYSGPTGTPIEGIVGCVIKATVPDTTTREQDTNIKIIKTIL